MISYCIVYPHPLYNLGLVSLMEKFKPGQTACIRTGLYPKECLLKISDWIGELIFIGVFSKGNDEIKLVEAIKKKSKKSQILLISTPEYSEVTRKCFIKGANGLVYVHSSEDLFLDALTRIISNEVVMPHGFRIHPDLNQMVANQRAAGRTGRRERRIGRHGIRHDHICRNGISPVLHGDRVDQGRAGTDREPVIGLADLQRGSGGAIGDLIRATAVLAAADHDHLGVR